jgi:Ca-activated chloride channel homolog
MAHIKRVVLLAVTLLSILWPQIVLADGMVLPLEADTGYLVVRYHHVTVDISDTHAVTRVEQAFYNPHPFEVEAQYLFPVPPEAILTSFKASVDGQQQDFERQGATVTNATLYDLVARRRDPSLLQYADWSTLTFEIVVPAHATRTMSLEYDEILAPTSGMAHYRYILSTERYSADLLEEASITVTLRQPDAAGSSQGLGTLYSPSHAVTTARLADGGAQVTWKATEVRPTEDFHLFFSPADGGFGSGLLVGEQPGPGGELGRHFLLLFAPELASRVGPALPKDIVFVVDRSGSMAGEKMEQARAALHYIVGQLGADDRFSIVSFDDRLESFAPTLQPVTGETVHRARIFVDDLTARDATDLDAGLELGLKILRDATPRRGAARLLVFLTDGLPTAGRTDPIEIVNRGERNNRRVEARLHVFGVGYDVNTHLLDQLAEKGRGSVTYVQPGEDLELVLSSFYRRIANPVLTDLEITFDGMTVTDLHPRSLPDMFEGSSLLMTGRFRPTGETISVTVSGRAGEEKRAFKVTLDLGTAAQHAFVPRLWATRQIGQLLDEIRVKGESETLVGQVRALGLTYGLVTPYTTFAIAAQVDGAASAENMALYGNQGELNQAFGQVTIQARVQNQSYQQANQASLASGANVTQNGVYNLAQVALQHVDLRLLQDRESPTGPITKAWIAENIHPDRTIDFGSEAYFELAADPDARAFLQAGNNVLFRYRGEVLEIRDSETPETAFEIESSNPAGATQRVERVDAGDNRSQTPDGSLTWLSRAQAVVVAAGRALTATIEAFVRGLVR